MSRKLPPFFRFTCIGWVRSYDEKKRKVIIRNVESYIFTFYEPKERDKNAVREAMWKTMQKIILQTDADEWAQSGEETMPVTHDETIGIGFYNVKTTVNDIDYSLTNIFGRWEKIFAVGFRFLRRLGVS